MLYFDLIVFYLLYKNRCICCSFGDYVHIVQQNAFVHLCFAFWICTDMWMEWNKQPLVAHGMQFLIWNQMLHNSNPTLKNQTPFFSRCAGKCFRNCLLSHKWRANWFEQICVAMMNEWMPACLPSRVQTLLKRPHINNSNRILRKRNDKSSLTEAHSPSPHLHPFSAVAFIRSIWFATLHFYWHFNFEPK